MSLGITWYLLDEVAAKYNLDKSLILKWVKDGVVRAEKADDAVVRINVDDLELKLREMTVV